MKNIGLKETAQLYEIPDMIDVHVICNLNIDLQSAKHPGYGSTSEKLFKAFIYNLILYLEQLNNKCHLL